MLSDGADTASDANLRDVTAALRRSDAFVYAIAIDSVDPQPINTRVNSAALSELTGPSGGRAVIVHSSENLMAAAADIAEELNSQYLVRLRLHARRRRRLPQHSRPSDRSGIPCAARSGYVAARRP